MAHRKGTLLLPSGSRSNPDQNHLHVVCNDTCILGLNLLVPVSTFYDGCDTTCELTGLDHDFIRHLSFVFYAKATLYKAEQIDRGYAIGLLIPQPDLVEDVFLRVKNGVCFSPDTPHKIKKYFEC